MDDCLRPLIKLRSKETSRCSTILRLAETFVLCHELAHFLNGDLNDEKSYCALPLEAREEDMKKIRITKLNIRLTS